MRPSLRWSISLLRYADVPQSSLQKVKPALQKLQKTSEPTLIDHLLAKKSDIEGEIAKAQEMGTTPDVLPWPSNLRIEPVIKRANLNRIHKDVRPQIKNMLRER